MATDKGVVYGLHAFFAENEDEISFAPGEEVVILEKDDQYGDGWWQVRIPPYPPSPLVPHISYLGQSAVADDVDPLGSSSAFGTYSLTFDFVSHLTRLTPIQGRNKAGQEGLFPVSYTSPDPPTINLTATSNSSHPLDKASLVIPIQQGAPQIHLSSPSGSARSLPRPGSQSPLRRSSSSHGLDDPTSAVAMNRSGSNELDIESAISQLNVNASYLSGSDSPKLDQRRISERSPPKRELSLYADSIDDERANGRASMVDDFGDSHLNDTNQHDEVGWSASTRKKLAEKAINENRKKELREREQEDQRRQREELDRETFQGGVPTGLEFSDESDDDDLDQKRTDSPALDAVRSGPVPMPIVPGVPLDKVLASTNGGVSLPSEDTRSHNHETRRRASIPVEPLVIAKNTPPSSSPAPPVPQDLPSSTANGDSTPAARSAKAADLALLEPSALAKEPSPYHTLLPDQPGPATTSSASPSISRGNSPLVTHPAAQPLLSNTPGSASHELAPPLDLGTLPPRFANSTPAVAPVASSATANKLGTPVDQLPSNPFDLQQTPSTSSTAPPSISSDTGGPAQTANRRPGSISQGLGLCGMPGEPMDWSVEEVVEWAQRRGFDESVWSKFQGKRCRSFVYSLASAKACV